MKGRRSFLVGRRSSAGMVMVLLDHLRGPFRGPWVLRALVAGTRPR